MDITKEFIKPDINLDYERKVFIQRQQNINEVLNDKGTIKKVKNFADRFGYHETFIY